MKHILLTFCALTLFALPACEEQSSDTQDTATSAQEMDTQSSEDISTMAPEQEPRPAEAMEMAAEEATPAPAPATATPEPPEIQQAPGAPEIQLQGIYSYATSESQKNGAIFLDIVNESDIDDKLIGVDVSRSTEKVEIHEMAMKEGEVMEMRKINSLEIPAQSTVSLEPSGHHIMLMGLEENLKAGESFFVNLTFEKAGRVSSASKIIEAGTTPEE